MRRVILAFTPPGARLVCDIAETSEQITKGLGGRAGLGPKEGMLFIMPTVKQHRFWMKGVSFSIDLLFFSPEAMLLDALEHVPPGPPLVLWGIDAPSRWVVEAPAGWVKRVGVEVGCQLSTAGWVKE